MIVILVQVKKTEKNVYKKKRGWSLHELKRVDGIDGNKVWFVIFPVLCCPVFCSKKISEFRKLQNSISSSIKFSVGWPVMSRRG